MNAPAADDRFRERAERLRADRNAVPWHERRALAAELGAALQDGRADPAIGGLVRFLADDPVAEVRKEVADLLVHLADDEFTGLAGKLTGDRVRSDVGGPQGRGDCPRGSSTRQHPGRGRTPSPHRL
jgi:hypothetical protein